MDQIEKKHTAASTTVITVKEACRRKPACFAI